MRSEWQDREIKYRAWDGEIKVMSYGVLKANELTLPSDDFLKKLFKDNSDCYADTWSQDGLGSPMKEGDMIQAMTAEQFVKVVKSIFKMSPNTR